MVDSAMSDPVATCIECSAQTPYAGRRCPVCLNAYHKRIWAHFRAVTARYDQAKAILDAERRAALDDDDEPQDTPLIDLVIERDRAKWTRE